jgi:hypothetical protein
MAYRFLMTAAGLAVALGQPAAARSDTARMADKMRDPAMQGAIVAAVRAISEAMLDMRVAPFLDAVEAVRDPMHARRVDPDTRVRDVAGPRAERMPEELSDRLPVMMGAMGGMADAVEAMTPALKDMAREMGRAMGEAVAGARRESGREDVPDRDDDVPSAQQE